MDELSKTMEERLSAAAKELRSNQNNDRERIVAASIGIFYGTLALSCGVQKMCSIATNPVGMLPNLIGFITVCGASLTSYQMASTMQWQQQYNPYYHRSKDRNQQTIRYLTTLPSTGSCLRICSIGVLAFTLLGGRFWAIAPSSYTNLGSFARASLPATERYANASQRLTIERLGKVFGCHTCGSRRIFQSGSQFVADHMPPKSVAEQLRKRWYNRLLRRNVSFRFYPQCITCSNKQGSILSNAIVQLQSKNLARAGIRQAYYHGFRPRVYHLTGGVVGAGLVIFKPQVNQMSKDAEQWIHRNCQPMSQWMTNTWRNKIRPNLPPQFR
jgi:hypothetical protein